MYGMSGHVLVTIPSVSANREADKEAGFLHLCTQAGFCSLKIGIFSGSLAEWSKAPA
jgi:hypothetical protein